MNTQDLRPGLYLVATPIGNLGDLTLRAREILSRASLLAGESSQAAFRLIEVLRKDLPEDWRAPAFQAYREASRDRDAQAILAALGQGRIVALVSDAGTPGISDPGWHLVDACRAHEFEVFPVPGPCAAIAALSVSGFPTRQFQFEGFLPASGKSRRTALARVVASAAPVVIYESPHRLVETLRQLAQEQPQRKVFVAREMTKKFEEHWRGTVEESVGRWTEGIQKGEFVLVLGPQEAEVGRPGEVSQETLDYVAALGLPTKQATALIGHFCPGADKKEIYRRLTR